MPESRESCGDRSRPKPASGDGRTGKLSCLTRVLGRWQSAEDTNGPDAFCERVLLLDHGGDGNDLKVTPQTRRNMAVRRHRLAESSNCGCNTLVRMGQVPPRRGCFDFQSGVNPKCLAGKYVILRLPTQCVSQHRPRLSTITFMPLVSCG